MRGKDLPRYDGRALGVWRSLHKVVSMRHRTKGEQMTEQTCDRCDKPMDPERECEACCQVLCSRCMYDFFALCNDCEAAVQEEEAAFPEEFEP